MTEKLKQGWHRWRVFKEYEPGHRFQSRYHRLKRHRERDGVSRYRQLLNLVGGPALIIAGILFFPTPGPSYIIIVLGLWMLAGEWPSLARLFDRTEVWLRRVGRWIQPSWSALPTPVKVLIVLLAVAAVGYGIYSLLFGG